MNDFESDLAYSHSQSDSEWWPVVYNKAFKGIASINDVRQDGWAQRGGIDRLIVLESGRTITIDEKVRRKDWGDILLEFWSSVEKKQPGWVEKELACDYIAYAFEPSQRCYLLPFLELQRAWFNNKDGWLNKYGKVEAKNAGYTTVSCPVPTRVLQLTLANGMKIEW